MKTLEHQLADYGNRQRELHGPISAEELAVGLGRIDQAAPVQPLHPMPQPARFRRPQGWLVAVGTAAAVFVLVGATALLFRAAETEGPSTESPSIVSSSSALAWSRVPYDEAVFGGEYEQGMSSVTAGGPGLVAVGSADADAAVWMSADGFTWSRVPNDEAVFDDARMEGVTAGGPGLVAVGASGPNAAVWTSVDGIIWSRVPHDEEVFGGEVQIHGGAKMNSVTVGGPGLVAVGFDGYQPGDAVVWTSVDGITWSRVPHDEAVFGGPDFEGFYGQSMLSVTAGGPGLVAVGWDGADAVVWTSVDGIAWSRVHHDDAAFGFPQEMESVTAGGPGLVAVGNAGRVEAAVWTSVDGITWSRVVHDEAVFGGEYELRMKSVAVGGPGLVAVGRDSMGAAVWTSIDGITWSRLAHDEEVFGGQPERPDLEMWSVTVGGPGLVVVGADGKHSVSGPANFDAAVWNATVED